MPTSSKPRAGPVTTGGTDDPFVGRRRELDAIGRSLEMAASGRGRLDIVSGAPGIGKTRLAHEVGTLAHGLGFGVLSGGCWEGEGTPAYWPWADILRSHLNGLPDIEPGNATDFSQLLEEASTRAHVRIHAVADAHQDAQRARFILFDRFCEFLAAAATSSPLLVIIDDAQAADAGSLLLLQFVAPRLARLPVAVLVTSREPLSEMVASTTRHAWTRHLVLRGLTRTEARELVRTRATRSPTSAMFDRLMHLTEGNPYFLKQLLIDGEPKLSTTHGVTLPASLLVVTLQTYRRLSLGCQTLLQAASLVGREFEADLPTRAIGLPIREGLQLLDEAVERQVVTPIGAARYQFAHALVREAIHDQLHPSTHTQLHESIALALERQAAAGARVSAATMAHHFCMGLPLTNRRQAALHSIAAGEVAHAAFAYEEAVFQLRRAHHASGTTLTELESCDLLLQLGAAEAGAGEWADSRRTFDTAAALARTINCPKRLARAALGFKGLMFGTIPVDVEAIVLLREALEHLATIQAPDLLARVYSALSRALYFADDAEMVNKYNSLAIDSARRLGDEHLAAELAETRLLANWQPSGFAVVRRSADQLLESSIRLHDPLTGFRARTYRYCCFLTSGDAQQAAHELRDASKLASTIQHPRSSWQMALLRAAQALTRGKLVSAAHLSAKARELGRRVHDSSPAHHDLVQSFQAVRLSKDYSGWLQVTAQSTTRYPSTIGYLAAQALVQAELKRLDESRDALRHFGNQEFRNIPANNFQLYTFAILAEAVANCNEAQWAQQLYSLMHPFERLHIVAGWGTAVDGSVAHYLALLASCMANRELATAHFDVALEANNRLEAPPLLARTQLEFARFLASSEHARDRVRARQLASSATDVFSALNFTHLRNECEVVLERIDDSIPPRIDTRTRHRAEVPNLILRAGDLWRIRYGDVETSVRHRLGFEYLARILEAAGNSLHVLDLVTQGSPPDSSVGGGEDRLGFDDKARLAYKGRLHALEQELQVAHQHNDLGQLELLRSEREHILQELSYSYGLAGRRRAPRSPAERARISVKNRITDALAALKPCHGAAHQHLSRSVVTGTYCRYAPPAPTLWNVITDGRR